MNIRALSLISSILAIAIFSFGASAMLIPPFFLNSVVAIGGIQTISIPGQPPRQEWQTEGTGFFYGHLIKDDTEPAKRLYEIYLVTARHVIQKHREAGRAEIQIRVNPKDSKASIQQFPVPDAPTQDAASWFFHPKPEIDLAIVRINMAALHQLGYEPDFFPGDRAALPRAKLLDRQVAAGDGTFVLGFPMNLAGVQKNYVIVRQGVIARITEMLDSVSNTFMIDTLVFPGNSGGPVVLKPELFSIEGTKSQPSAELIGVVTSYRPYTDVAVSPQTGRPRIVFEENSGLAEVLPVDYVNETIDAWRKSQGLKPGQTTPASEIKGEDAK